MNGRFPSLSSHKSNVSAFILGLVWDCGMNAVLAAKRMRHARLMSTGSADGNPVIEYQAAYYLSREARMLRTMIQAMPQDKQHILQLARHSARTMRNTIAKREEKRRAA